MCLPVKVKPFLIDLPLKSFSPSTGKRKNPRDSIQSNPIQPTTFITPHYHPNFFNYYTLFLHFIPKNYYYYLPLILSLFFSFYSSQIFCKLVNST